ncbi:Ceramide synthase 6 [Astathelohania contejeani]|uniref:Ceramide synthase 6 n=1 Tax=Astathelohania contejeani TaxID=164912 RepID=A0ABQ7I2D4_9MICR|nr:Ceramide synthase 6 [Thelohania contejeani]
MEMAKLNLYLKNQSIADNFFAVFAVVFGVLRILVFPLWIIRPIWRYKREYEPNFVFSFLTYSLMTLYILNAIWMFLIIKMVYKLVKVGKVTNDIREKKNK